MMGDLAPITLAKPLRSTACDGQRGPGVLKPFDKLKINELKLELSTRKGRVRK